MPKYNYSFKVGENTAQAVGMNLPISTKQSIEICKFIRGKSLDKAKKMLEDTVKKKIAVPFTRFNRDMGHKKKIGPGRYPMKACIKILSIVESAEANGQFKGLATTNMIVKHASAQRAAKNMRWGRRGRQAKNTTIEIVLKEEKTAEKKKEKKAEVPKKKEIKKETAKVDKKEETSETKVSDKKEIPKDVPKIEKPIGEPKKAEEKKEEAAKKEVPKEEKKVEEK
jgi:large subunit ribosomal protein L22